MSALHRAVAHGRARAARALLAAKADPRLGAEFGNAPLFAAVRGDKVGPYANRIRSRTHFRALRHLLRVGASLRDRNRRGETLLDLALATSPYAEEALAYLGKRKVNSSRLGKKRLAALLRNLPYGEERELRARVNEVRFLLERGADPNEESAEGETPLQALFSESGYSKDEVPPEVLLELVHLLLKSGARDTPTSNGATALAMAEGWVKSGLSHYAPIVKRLRSLV